MKVDDKSLAAFLEEQGRLRRVGDGFAVSRAAYERGLEPSPGMTEITRPRFATRWASAWRTAQLMLERYDADGVTRRLGDRRVLRRR